ncbi:MAG TPA: hypothetical protein VGH37_02270 [Candidatus Acidoferrum sp.]
MIRMIGHSTVVAVLLMGAVSLLRPSIIRAQLKSGSCNEYRGTLGKNTEIGLSLYAKEQELEGSYFYKKHLEDIPLTGQYTSARDISLAETDSSNKLRGTFSLHFAEHDSHFQTVAPLQAEVLEGKWVSADGQTTYPVYLQLDHECTPSGQSRYAVSGATNDEIVEKNVQAFYNAVIAGNRSVAAKFVSYPATYYDGKQNKIINSAAFLREYDQIFTLSFVAEIAKGIPHRMFVNSQGIMIAGGKVWFDADGKAKRFNTKPNED